MIFMPFAYNFNSFSKNQLLDYIIYIHTNIVYTIGRFTIISLKRVVFLNFPKVMNYENIISVKILAEMEINQLELN